MAKRIAAADRVVVDLGTGDGRAAVVRARRESTAFVIGLDANAAAMAESSLRAARAPAKGGLPNLLFAVAAAERPPAELRGRVDEVSILFPWGSLLRGVLGLDPVAGAGITAFVAPGGRVDALVSVTDRDTATLGLRPLLESDAAEIARRWRDLGLELTTFRPAAIDDVAASGSTWARRFGAGRRLGAGARGADRRVWRIRLRCSGALGRTG